MTLDEQLRALCEQHDLCALSISAHRHDGGRIFYSANAQTFVSGSRLGAQGIKGDPAGAIAEAIEGLNAKRVRSVAVSELEAA